MPNVTSERNGYVTVIRMCFEKKLNSLEKIFRDELKHHLREFARCEKSRVAVLTGSGKAFCTGGSLSELGGDMTAVAAVDYMKEIGEIVVDITGMEKPVIASVNGAAVGAGFNIALACDLIIAASDAKFSQTFTKVGLVPDLGGHYFLPRIIGLHKAKELIFTAKMLTAAEALEMGLVNHVVDPLDLLSYSIEIASSIAAGPQRAIIFSKSILSKGLELSLNDILEYEAYVQSICM